MRTLRFVSFTLGILLSCGITAGAENVTIAVRAVDGEDNPVSGAKAYLVALDRSSLMTEMKGETETDAEGVAAFNVPAPDDPNRTYLFVAAHKQGTAWGVKAAPGGEAADVRLGEPASLAGRVTDPDGNPVAGVRVWPSRAIPAVRSPERHELWAIAPLLAVETNADGRFVLKDLPKGYAVTLLFDAPEGFGDLTLGEMKKDERRGWLAPEEEADIRLDRAGRIAGSLREEKDGESVPGMLIRAETLEPECIYITRTGVDGRFEFTGAIPGSYRVRAVPAGSEFAGLLIPLPGLVEVESGMVTELALLWSRGVIVEGTVADAETGAPVAGARVSIRYRIPNPPMTRTETGVTDDKGHFRVRVLRGECGGTVQADDYPVLIFQKFTIGQDETSHALDVLLTPAKKRETEEDGGAGSLLLRKQEPEKGVGE
jgi:hypothetical protein